MAFYRRAAILGFTSLLAIQKAGSFKSVKAVASKSAEAR
jgi:hypothetical protein